MSIKNTVRRSFLAFSTILLLMFALNVQAQDSLQTTASEIPTDESTIGSGETLFKNNCAVCHEVHTQKIGPALANVYDRRPLDWIKAFVRNSQKVIKSGDEYAVNLYNKFNNTEMTAFPDFSDEEISSIVAYIKSETEKGPATQETASATSADATTVTTQQPSFLSSGVITVFLVLLLVVLVLILVVLFVLISVLTKYLKQKAELDEGDREIIEQKFNFVQYVKSPAFIWIVSFVFVAIVLKTVIDGLYSVGVQQGYAPTQPIAFSHKLHAGQYQINCNYCHTGVRNSKNANIPSANICMNCHTSIVKVTGADQPSVEIQKIKDAVDNNTPIEWVRVHNLPDLAYFNHSQHFNVGGIECQTCHGTVEEMDVISQQTNLTMGWCIDCHRTTNINSEGNAYYDKLVEIHSKTSKEPLKVEDIGGLECSKCHY